MRHFDFIGGIICCGEAGCRGVFATVEAYLEHWEEEHNSVPDDYRREPVCAAHGDMRGC